MMDMDRDACKEGAPEWAIASAGVAAMKVLIFSIFISKNFLNWAGSRDVIHSCHFGLQRICREWLTQFEKCADAADKAVLFFKLALLTANSIPLYSQPCFLQNYLM